jgi:type II secretory pathway component PulJ
MFVAPVSRTTSIRRPLSRVSGLTLAELMMAIAITSLIVVVALILAVSTGRSFVEMVNYVDLDHNNRMAMDIMTRDLRQVQGLQSFSSNSLVFFDKDGQSLQYTYSPAEQALIRLKGTEKVVVLENCDKMLFGVYQRTPKSNSFDLYPVTLTTNTKVIRVTWNCTRTLFGRKVNSEQAQCARIVIRNKKEL